MFIFIDFTLSMSIVHPYSGGLEAEPMVAAAWRDVAQLKGEGAAFVVSKVCSLIFQFGRKCSFTNVFMCAFYVNCKLLVRCSP